MSTMDEIKRMRVQGIGEPEIVGELRKKGIPEQEITNSLSQSKIKDAVSSDGEMVSDASENYAPQEGSQFSQQQSMPPIPEPSDSEEIPSGMMNFGNATTEYSGQMGQNYDEQYSEMQPSMLSAGAGEEGAYSSQAPEEYGPFEQNNPKVYPAENETYGAEAYPQYRPYQEAISSDVITEISEQVVSEKLFALQDKLEKVIDMKTIFEARITNLVERLNRMEHILDKIQISILQKVGDYVTDVKDVRRELEETQKSFVAADRKRKKGKKH